MRRQILISKLMKKNACFFPEDKTRVILRLSMFKKKIIGLRYFVSISRNIFYRCDMADVLFIVSLVKIANTTIPDSPITSIKYRARLLQQL